MNELAYNKAAFIGAGKLAHSLLPALSNTGIKVYQIISKSLSSAVQLAEENNVPEYSNNISKLRNEVNVVILSVPDSQIKITAEQIARLNISFPKKLFIHLSGSLNINELKLLQDKGAGTASLHIMHSFPSRSVIKFNRFPAAIETNNDDVFEFLFELCKKMNLYPFPINSETKVYYHMMGVFALNFTTANFYNAEKLRTKIEDKVPETKDLLYESALETLKNINQKGIVESLSGPVERGDIATIRQHINAINDNKLLLLNYITSSLTLLETAHDKKSILPEQFLAVQNYLTNELQSLCNRIISENPEV